MFFKSSCFIFLAFLDKYFEDIFCEIKYVPKAVIGTLSNIITNFKLSSRFSPINNWDDKIIDENKNIAIKKLKENIEISVLRPKDNSE